MTRRSVLLRSPPRTWATSTSISGFPARTSSCCVWRGGKRAVGKEGEGWGQSEQGPPPLLLLPALPFLPSLWDARGAEFHDGLGLEPPGTGAKGSRRVDIRVSVGRTFTTRTPLRSPWLCCWGDGSSLLPAGAGHVRACGSGGAFCLSSQRGGSTGSSAGRERCPLPACPSHAKIHEGQNKSRNKSRLMCSV